MSQGYPNTIGYQQTRMDKQLLKEFLEEKYLKYNSPDFIETDPVQIPHMFSDAGDIEIAGFLTASIAWGQRTTIINNAKKLMKMMDNSPYDFILNAGEKDCRIFQDFKHRTFNGVDAVSFIKSLRIIYLKFGGLKFFFENSFAVTGNLKDTLIKFRKVFIQSSMPQRTHKHISDIEKNASAKRLNLFLRWMVRKDNHGVDFGIWDKIPSSALYIPLDVHTGNVARSVGLLTRRQNDWMAVEELTSKLREFDPADPVKYDYALFGMGIFENFK